MILTTPREYDRMYQTLCLETDREKEGEKVEEAKEMLEHELEVMPARDSVAKETEKEHSHELDDLERDKIFIHNIVATLGIVFLLFDAFSCRS
jgi:hypothetical protein